jgi:hypothetical protein
MVYIFTKHSLVFKYQYIFTFATLIIYSFLSNFITLLNIYHFVRSDLFGVDSKLEKIISQSPC